MDWICEIEKHAGTLGRPPIFKDAMTTLSFRLEESLKEDINLLAEYLKRRCDKSSAGAVARAFIAAGVQQMKSEYPDLQKFLDSGAAGTMVVRSFRNGRVKGQETTEGEV